MYFELIVEIQHCSQTTLSFSIHLNEGEGPKLNKILINDTLTKPFKKLLKKDFNEFLKKNDFAISLKWCMSQFSSRFYDFYHLNITMNSFI